MTDLADLRRQLEAAYAGIQEVDEDLAAGRISPTDHADLKRRSERQAATLVGRIREAEQAAAGAPPSEAAPSARRAGRDRLRSPVVLAGGAAGILLFGVVLGVLVARYTSDDVAPAPATAAPPPAATGGMPGARRAEVSPALEALRKEVEVENPPIARLLAFAHQALDEGQTAAAIWAYKRVLAREPKNVEAITHIGLILYQGNHVDQGLARIDEALSIDPKYAHAHWDRANILLHARQDYRGAAAALETFLTLVPTGEDADRARTMLADAKKRLE